MDTQAGRVVVGHDGSPHAGAVLDRAAEADRIEADQGPSQLEQCDPSRSGPSSLPPTPTSDED
jgi:hypothetical protein